jgi:hypothetical protein
LGDKRKVVGVFVFVLNQSSSTGILFFSVKYSLSSSCESSHKLIAHSHRKAVKAEDSFEIRRVKNIFGLPKNKRGAIN